MDREIIGIMLTPIVGAIWLLTRRDYTGALGAFIVAIVAFPVLHWLKGQQPPPWVYYTVGGVALVLSGIQLIWFLRWKAQSKDRE